MQFRTLAVVAVALLVALSGCAALDGAMTDDQSDETEDETKDETELEDGDDEADESSENETSESSSGDGLEEADDAGDGDATTESDTEDATVEPNDEDATAESDDEDATTEPNDGGATAESDDEDTTAEAEWEPPKQPNRPMEDEREDRIESVEFVDEEPAEDGEGYSNFNLEVVANTSMENVDPPEHGDVVGEPYFFVKINEGADDQKIVERTGHVDMDETGTFHIEVRPAGIEEFGEGPLTVEVFLMDEDKDWDDIYDAVETQIYFNPATETAGSNTDGDGNDDSTSDER